MPAWMVAVLILFSAYFVWQTVRAVRQGVVSSRFGPVERKTQPVMFVMLASVYALGSVTIPAFVIFYAVKGLVRF